MQAKSWNQFIEMIAYDKEGNTRNVSALYVVAIPNADRLEKNVDFSCYRPTYISKDIAEKIGKAYGVSTEFDIKEPEKYNILGYRPDLDLYIFKENISFQEGLEKIYEILKDYLKEEGFEVERFEIIT